MSTTVGAERIRNFDGSPLFCFPMVFCFERNGGHFVQHHWKSEQNDRHFVPISNDLVLEWSDHSYCQCYNQLQWESEIQPF